MHYGKNTGCFSKKFAQSLDTFGLILYLCTDIGQGRTLWGGLPKLGSFTFFGGAFVIIAPLKYHFTKLQNFYNQILIIGTSEGNERGSAHVCEEMRLERLYLSVYSDVIIIKGATPYDVAPSDE